MKFAKLFAIIPILGIALITSCGPKDADIQARLTETLKTVPGVNADVSKGVVTLSGNVMDAASKAAAENAVKAEKGVKSIVNNIMVSPPAATTPAPAAPIAITPDEALTKAVADATKDYPGVTAVVKDGVISLKGTLAADKWKKLKMALDALSPKKVDAAGITLAK